MQRTYTQTIRNINNNFGYVSYTLNMAHAYGTITDTMDFIRAHKKENI
jgi:hypothetical protein